MYNDYENQLFVVYSETLNDYGVFVRNDNGEIEVDASDSGYSYEDLNSYWKDSWEFVGLIWLSTP